MLSKSVKSVLTMAAVGCAITFSGVAAAGECPADQVSADARTSGETTPVGVTDEVITAIDLSSKGAAFEGYMLRLRKLVVQPNGVVPWHPHNERAAQIYIMSGSITEYRSTCKVGIDHTAGDATAEFGDNLAHWWKNNTDKETVIISTDLLPPQSSSGETM